MFCVQYVNDHSRKFLSAYEEHYIFSLSVLGNRFLSLLCPTFMQVITCSQFQPVPFLLYLFLFSPKREQPSHFSLYLFIYLDLFCPKPLSKKIQPLFLFAFIRVGHNYYCLFMFVVISILFFAYFIFALTLQLNYSTF